MFDRDRLSFTKEDRRGIFFPKLEIDPKMAI
jgi:hypothetical protein